MTWKLLRNPFIAFVFSNLLVLVHFVGWMSFSSILSPDYMATQKTLSFPLFINSLLFGLACSFVINIFIGLPALNRLKENKKSSLESYVREIALWIGIWCGGIGLLVAVFGMPVFLFTGAVILFTGLSIPIYLAGLFYWYTAVSPERNLKILAVIAILFLMWNLEASVIALILTKG